MSGEMRVQVQCYCIVDREGHLWKSEQCPPAPVDETDEHEAPEHLVVGGDSLGWSAKDLAEDELVDDEWIRYNTRRVQ